MDKYNIMAALLEEPQFDDTAVLMITVENGELELTPMGGQFKTHKRETGVEAYRLQQFLLDSAAEYGGATYEPTKGLRVVAPREKH